MLRLMPYLSGMSRGKFDGEQRWISRMSMAVILSDKIDVLDPVLQAVAHSGAPVFWLAEQRKSAVKAKPVCTPSAYSELRLVSTCLIS